MTHKDIYTKFMIEYDKANVTSSYPSLTEYEVATVLDKAYHALIAQKVTGNNVRRVSLEGDLKNISDLAPLIKNSIETISKVEDLNVYKGPLPNDYLYYITANLIRKNLHMTSLYTQFFLFIGNKYDDYVHLHETSMKGNILIDKEFYTALELVNLFGNDGYFYNMLLESDINDVIEYRSTSLGPVNEPAAPTFYYYFRKTDIIKLDDHAIDNIINRKVKVKLVNHQIADKFIASDCNIPWVKNPVCYIENSNVYVVCDSWNTPTENTIDIVYIKTPNKFVKELNENEYISTQSYFDYTLNTAPNVRDNNTIDAYNSIKDELENKYKFECNDTVAEELISLAVAFALENVESQRLNSKLNMRGLEA